MKVRYAGARQAGLTEVKIPALGNLASDLFTPRERAALKFAELMASDHHKVDDGVFADLKRHFSDAEIVELGVSTALFTGFGRFNAVAGGPVPVTMASIDTDRTGRFLPGASYPGHKLPLNSIGPPGTVQPPHQVLTDHPNAHSILADASNRHVVALTLGNDLVNVFRFDGTTGMLAPGTPPSVRVKEKAGPRHFAFHPNGRLVYVLGELDASVYVFDYDGATGQLKEKQSISALPPDFQGKPSAADLHITPDGKFLYGSERTSSTLAGFKIDPASGMLSSIGSVPTEKQPRGLDIEPCGT